MALRKPLATVSGSIQEVATTDDVQLGKIGAGTVPSFPLHVVGNSKLGTLSQGYSLNERYYPNVISAVQNNTTTGTWVINTPIPRAGNVMFTIRVHGYANGTSDRVDFTVAGYAYSGINGNVDSVAGAISAYTLQDLGTDGYEKNVGINSSGKVAVSFGKITDSIIYNRLSVDAWVTLTSTDYDTGWSVTQTTTAGFGWLDLNGPLTSNFRNQLFVDSTGVIGLGTSAPANFKLDVAGSVGPHVNNTYNLGSSSYKWATAYATNFQGNNLKLDGSTSGTLTIHAAATTSNWTITMPSDGGTNGYFLQTNGSGVLSWAAVASGTINVAEVDGTPTISGITDLNFDQTKGFVVTNPSGTTAQVSLSAIPLSTLAALTGSRGVVTNSSGTLVASTASDAQVNALSSLTNGRIPYVASGLLVDNANLAWNSGTSVLSTGAIATSNATPFLLTNGQTASVALTSQTVGGVTLTIPDFAGVSDTFVFTTKAQTLASKNLVAGSTYIVDGTTPSKTIQFNTSGAAASTTLALYSVVTSGTKSIYFPDANDTLVGKATTDTFTNKTFDTAGTGNVFRVNGTQITAVTGTGNTVVLSTSPTFVTDLTSPIVKLSGTSNQLVFQSSGVTGTLSWSPASSNKTIVLPNGSTDFTATGGTSFVLRQSSAGAAITVSQLAASDLSNGTTGSGAVVLATSPTLTTPNLGTPSTLVLTNATGLPVGSITGLGTGVATWLATPSSANLASAMTDKTGSGLLAFATSPSFTTPTLGVASATSLSTSAATPLILTNGQAVNIAVTSQTVGATTLTIPNFASVSDTFVFTTLAQTLTNKTLTSPTIAKIGNLNTNGYVSTTSSDGTLVVVSASSILDSIGSTQGQVLYRGSSGWAVLSPGTSGQVLTTGGASANPLWTTNGVGTVTATGGALTANAVVLGAGTTDTKVVTGITTDGVSVINLGVNATTAGSIKLFGGTSGDVTLVPTAAAGTATVLTLPASSDTLVGKATTDTFTNKTFDTAGAGNVFRINGTQISAITGTGAAVLANTPTLITPVLGVASATSISTSAATPLILTNGQAVNIAVTSQTVGATTLTIPNFASVSDTFVFTTLTQTLVNKTLTSPTIAKIGNLTTNGYVSTTNSDGTLTVVSASSILDSVGSTQGQILYRGSGGWSVLSPGTSGQVLTTGGAAANPSWTTNGVGTVTNTGGNLTSNAVVLGAGTADIKVATGITTDGTSKLNLGVAGASTGAIVLANTTSGTLTVTAPSTGALGTGVLTLPVTTDTLIGKATTDTLTNKTFDTAGSGNVFRINGTGITAVTGSGSVVLATSPTLVTPTLGVASATSLSTSSTVTVGSLTAGQMIAVSTAGLLTTSSNALLDTSGNATLQTLALPNQGSKTTSQQLYAYGGAAYFGDKRFAKILSKTIAVANAAAAHTYYDLYKFVFGSLQGTFRIRVVADGSGYGQEACFIIPTTYNMDYYATTTGFSNPFSGDTWVELSSYSKAPRHLMPNLTDIKLQFRFLTANANAIEIRVKETLVAGGAHNLYVYIDHSQEFDGATITEYSSSGTDSTAYGQAAMILSTNDALVSLRGSVYTDTLRPTTDASYDLGVTGTFRYRDLFLSRNASVGGALTAATLNGNTFTTGTYTLTGSAGKTLTFTNSLTLSGTDSSTLNIGTGGTLGTAAYITLGANVGTWLTTPSSANLAAALTDKTGTGVNVFATSPTLVTPVLGVASATSLSTSAATPLILTNGQAVNIAVTSQTVGATTLTIPDFASVSDTFAFVTKAQTLVNKTLTSPTIAKIGNLTSNGYVATSGGDGTLSVVSASSILDSIGSTQGQVLYRGASGWSVLATGTSGQVLTTGGAGADPSWTTNGVGTLTNTGGNLTTNSVILGANNSTDTKVVAGITTDGISIVNLGVNNTTAGKIKLFGGTSGDVTLIPTAAAGTATILTLPASSDTLVGKATTDTFTNKTFDTAGTGNVFRINGTGITAVVGTGSAVLATSPTFVTGITSPIVNLSGTSNQLVFQSAGITGTLSWSPASSNKTIVLPNGSTDFTATGGTSQVLKQTSAGGAITVAQLAASDLSNGTTGSGAVVLATSPTLTTPNLGTPSTLVLTNATGLPVGSITGLGTGVATWLATPSSANLASAMTDKTGSGVMVFATSPTLVTPVLGVATATTINKITLTQPATGATLTIIDGKTLTANNSLTLTGTDSTTMTFPSSSDTISGLGAAQTYTGVKTFSPAARSGSTASYFTITTPADTGITATNEAIGINFTAGTRTWQDGTTALQRERVFAAPTYNKTTTSAIFTTAVNVDIADPIAGTGVTITNGYSLRAVNVLFTGVIKAGSTPTTLTDSAGKILSAALNTVAVAQGGTGQTSAGIASFNAITGYTAAGATGTTSTNLVFSGSPTITSPTIAKLANLTSNGYVTTSGGDGTLSITTASGILDTIGATQGQILFRGASGWTVLGTGTSGQVLTTGGAAADPTWTTNGTGTVTATGGALTANSIVLGAGTTDTKVVAGITTDGVSIINLGVNATTAGKVKMFGVTSGDVTLVPTAAAGTATVLTLPNVSDTLIGKATTDTLTNKTFDTAGTGNVFRINGTQITATTGSGSAVLATSPTFGTSLTSPIVNLSGTSNQLVFQSAGVTGTISWSPASSNKTITLPNGSTDFTATGGTSFVLRQSSAGAAITVSQLAASDLSNGTTGSGSVVLATSPTLTTPVLGVATATTINKITLTQPATGATLTLIDGKTFTVNNTLTLSGTDSTTMTFPSASDTVAGLGAANIFTNQMTHNVARTIVSATAATLDDIYVQAATTTVTGNTGSPITKLNKVGLYRPTLTDASVVTVTDAATLYIDNSPLAAGSLTITNPWSILVAAGNVKFAGTGNVLGTITSGTWNGTAIGVAYGGTGQTSAGIAAFNAITGYTASGATGTTSTNLVFSGSPTITSPTIAKLANLTSNGYVSTTSGDGTLVIVSASSILDSIGSTQGQILYRGSGGWAVLGTGTSGQVLTTGGAAANPSWTTAATGTVTATGGALTANSIVLGAGTTDTKVVAGITTDGISIINLGVNNTTAGKVKMFGGTSGDVTLIPTAAAGTATVLTLPAVSDTLVGKATTDTFTNKTYDTAGTGNVFRVNGTQISSVTGSGSAVVLGTSPTFTTDLTSPIVKLSGTSNQLVFQSGGVTGTISWTPSSGNKTITLPNGTTDFTATGGTSFVLRQSSVGAAITVSQLAASDLSNGTTGSGAVVLATSATLVTPALGTPSSGTLTNCTGYTVGNISGLGTGVATFLATPSSANLASALTDKTGTGVNVFATSPTLVTPNIGAATGLSFNLTSSTTTGDANTLTANSLAPAAAASGSSLDLVWTNASSNTSGTSTVNGLLLTPTQNITGAGIHNTIGINLGVLTLTATAGTPNKYAIYAPSSNNWGDLFNYNGTSVINSTGQVNAAQLTGTVPSGSVVGSYTSLTGVGTITTGTWNGTVVGVQYGGTGLATLTANSLQVGNGTGNVTQLAVGGSGTILQGVSSSNPTWTATPTIGVASASTGSLTFAHASSSFSTTLRASASTAASITYVLPINKGSAGQVLTDAAGDGVLSWTTNGSGTVTATGGSLTANAVVLGAGTTDTKVVAGITTDGTSIINLGVNATTIGKIKLFGNTSGDATIQPAAAAGTATVLTLPNTSTTLIGDNNTATLTNKTFNTAGTGNTFQINGTGITAVIGSGSTVVLATSPTFTTDITTPVAKLSGTSNQLIFQSAGVTGTISWAPASSNKTITLPNGTTDFTATGGTSQVLRQSSAGAAITVSQLAASDLSNGTTGSNAVVLATSPTLTTPVLGVATATTINKITLTQPATGATLTLIDGKTLTVNNTLTLAGTDSTTMTFPAASTTVAGLGTTQTFTGINTFTPAARSSGSTPYLTINIPADTTLAANTEAIGISHVAAIRQFATVTTSFATQREVVFGAPTYGFVGASTLTTAINVDIADPVQGTNATLTNIYSLRAANVLFTGIIKAGSSPTTLTDSAGKILSAALNTVGAAQGGTGLNTSASSGVPSINSGTWSANTITQNGVMYGGASNALSFTAQGGANTVLVANSGAPSFSAAITIGTSVTSPTINATTALQLNGTSINTAGTLANVAYLNQANVFTTNQVLNVGSTDANTTPPALDINGNYIRIGDGYSALTFTNGIGIKFHDGGIAHCSIKYLPGSGRMDFGPSGSNSWLAIDSNAETVSMDFTNKRLGVASTAPTSTLYVNGSVGTVLTTKTSNYTATVNDHKILVDATSGAVTITLPTAASITGREYIIKDWKGKATTNTITIATTSSQTVDGATTYVIAFNYDSVTVVSDGSNWVIL